MSGEEIPRELIDLLDKHKVTEAFSGILKQYLDSREAELKEKFFEPPQIIEKKVPKHR